MKTISKMVVILLMVLGSSTGLSAEVKNFFINGVNNSFKEAEDSAKFVKSSIPEIGEVKALHNTNVNFISDFYEAGRMSLNWDKFYAEEGRINTDQQIKTLAGEYYRNEYGKNSDNDHLIDVLSTIYSIKEKEKSGEGEVFIEKLRSCSFGLVGCAEDLGIKDSDIRGWYRAYFGYEEKEHVIILGHLKLDNPNLRVLNKITQEWEDIFDIIDNMNISKNDKINFIAHSQGNLFMNGIAQILVEEKELPVENIRLLSVSTPAGFVYPHSKENSGNHYITLEEDIVSRTFKGSLSRNNKNYDGTSSLIKIAGYALINYKYYTYANEDGETIGDLSGHGFREVYMKEGTASREWIRKRYLENYNDLKALDENETVISLNHKTWINSLPEASNENPTAGNTISVDVTVGYSSNQARSQTVKTCFRITNSESWSDVSILVHNQIRSSGIVETTNWTLWV